MNKNVHDFVELIERNKGVNTKEEMISIVTQTIAMVRDGRAVFHTNFFAVVFCYSKNSSFSNVVLSLSKLEKYDHIPCFVVLVRKNLDNVIYMINTTLLDKISHSSQELRVDNIRGSFLGSNIRKELPEIGKVNVNPAKRNVLDLKNETCKNRKKRNVLKISHTRHFKTTKKQSKTGCFYSF